jgi:hypothetical protein
MNTDDFEKQLQSQSLRQPPAEWREEILAAARANIRPDPQPRETGLLVGWRALLARFPIAWGAVAAIWLAIIGVNSWMSGPSTTSPTGGLAAAPVNSPSIWSLQRAEISLLADHLSPVSEPRQRRQEPAPAPRSDRRREDGFGVFECEDALVRVV